MDPHDVQVAGDDSQRAPSATSATVVTSPRSTTSVTATSSSPGCIFVRPTSPAYHTVLGRTRRDGGRRQRLNLQAAAVDQPPRDVEVIGARRASLRPAAAAPSIRSSASVYYTPTGVSTRHRSKPRRSRSSAAPHSARDGQAARVGRRAHGAGSGANEVVSSWFWRRAVANQTAGAIELESGVRLRYRQMAPMRARDVRARRRHLRLLASHRR